MTSSSSSSLDLFSFPGGSNNATTTTLFAHMRNRRMCRQPPSVISAAKLTLENVAAYNVEVDVGDTRTSTVIRLREVPAFLIDAFATFGRLNGCHTEGIFRKEGSSTRWRQGCLPLFFGAERIPDTFLVHDVCCLIKRFFRDLKSPIFGNKEEQILKFATTMKEDGQEKVNIFKAFMDLVDKLPQSHVSTLGYLMRCLHEVCSMSDVHLMTTENVAKMFAPCLFTPPPTPEVGMKSKKRESRENLVIEARNYKKNLDMMAFAVQVFIENAHSIGVPSNCYKASRRPSDIKKKEHRLIMSSAMRPPVPEDRQSPTPSSSARSEQSNDHHLASGSDHGHGIHSALRKQSRSSNNLAAIAATFVSSRGAVSTGGATPSRNMEENALAKKRSKQQRSNSVVKFYGAISRHFKKSTSNLAASDMAQGIMMNTPDPPRLENKRIPMREKVVTPSPSPDSLQKQQHVVQLKDQNRWTTPQAEISNAVISPKDSMSKKRLPLPNFDTQTQTPILGTKTSALVSPMPQRTPNGHDSGHDDKKENIQIAEAKKSDVGSGGENVRVKTPHLQKKEPMGISTLHNIQRHATQLNRRPERRVMDRERRHTAPVAAALKRNQPNTPSSGLSTKKPVRVASRRNSSKGSHRNSSVSSESSEDGLDLNVTKLKISDQIRRARKGQRTRQRGPTDSMSNILGNPFENSIDLGDSRLPDTGIDNDNDQLHTSGENFLDVGGTDTTITSDASTTLDASMDMNRQISQRALSVPSPAAAPMKSILRKPTLSVDVHVTSPAPTRSYSSKEHAQVTPSPDSGCSSASSRQLLDQISVKAASVQSSLSGHQDTHFPIQATRSVDTALNDDSFHHHHQVSRTVTEQPQFHSSLADSHHHKPLCQAPPRPPHQNSPMSPSMHNFEPVFAVPMMPASHRRPTSSSVSSSSTPSRVDIRSSGTSIMLHTASSRAKCREPIKSTSSSRASSKSPSRMNMSRPVYSSRQTSDASMSDFCRPSLTGITGSGVVGKRIEQLEQLSVHSSFKPGTTPVFATMPADLSRRTSKPMVKPASHNFSFEPFSGSTRSSFASNSNSTTGSSSFTSTRTQNDGMDTSSSERLLRDDNHSFGGYNLDDDDASVEVVSMGAEGYDYCEDPFVSGGSRGRRSDCGTLIFQSHPTPPTATAE